ncbi:MAG: hypothetical protein KZQ95_17575 [Candidatus Thiodiazotropha sp. (ex Epidulcina cf. delphinae)]|nr:hypothetical protein [Candidatus Thiodiazotropha sp. (ex Epidulcina cf. delphinae)]
MLWQSVWLATRLVILAFYDACLRPKGTIRHEGEKTAIIRYIQKDTEADMGHGITLERSRPENHAPSYGGDRLGCPFLDRSVGNNFLFNECYLVLMSGLVQQAFIRRVAHGG